MECEKSVVIEPIGARKYALRLTLLLVPLMRNQDARNLATYLSTKFLRFLVALVEVILSTQQRIGSRLFPLLDMTRAVG